MNLSVRRTIILPLALFSFFWCLVFFLKLSISSYPIVAYPDFSFYHDYAYKLSTSLSLPVSRLSESLYIGDLRDQWRPSPFHSMLVLLTLVVSGSPFFYHLLGFVFGLLTLIFQILCIKTLVRNKLVSDSVTYASFLLCLSPSTIVESVQFSSDIVLSAFLSAAVYLVILIFIHSLPHRRQVTFILGFLLVLASVIRPNAIIFVIGLFISWSFCSPRPRNNLTLFLLSVTFLSILLSRLVFSGYPHGGFLYYFWPNSWLTPGFMLDQLGPILTLNPFSPNRLLFAQVSPGQFLVQILIIPFLSVYKFFNLLGIPSPNFTSASIVHLVFYLYRLFYSLFVTFPAFFISFLILFSKSKIFSLLLSTYFFYLFAQSFFVGGPRYMIGIDFIPIVLSFTVVLFARNSFPFAHGPSQN